MRLQQQRGGVRDRAQLILTIRRLYIDQYRRARVISFESLEKVTEIANPECLLSGVLAAADLEKPLARLREEEREALFLNVVEGYTAQEIADLTQRPRNSVLSLIHRARTKLRRDLGPSGAPAAAELGVSHER